jgi:putative MFS transporter
MRESLIDENIQKTNEAKHIDKFFDKIGYSRYQIFLLITCILVFFADGTEVLVITLILKSLENEWKITPLEKSFIASSAFIGLMIGSVITSKNLDKYGRKKFLLFGGGIVIIFGLASAYSFNSITLFISRILMGIGIGTQIIAATNLAAESIPTKNRSHFLANMWIAFPFGEMYVCIIGLNVMPNFETGQWRVLLLYSLVPVVLCFLTSFFLLESSRFYLAHGKYEEATQILNTLSSYSNTHLEQGEIDLIIIESKNNVLNKYESNYSILITKRFFNLSVNTWCIWLFSSLSLYTAVYMLPQILVEVFGVKAQKGNLFIDVMISNLISLPKTMAAGFISEIPFIGRKYSMSIGFALNFLSIVILLIDVERIYYYSGLIKLLSGMIMAIVKIYCCEAYPTKIRGMGYGLGHSFARLGGIMVSFLSEGLRYSFGLFSPYYFLAIICLIGVVNSYFLPFETLGRNLDHIEKEDIIELRDVKENKDFS